MQIQFRAWSSDRNLSLVQSIRQRYETDGGNLGQIELQGRRIWMSECVARLNSRHELDFISAQELDTISYRKRFLISRILESWHSWSFPSCPGIDIQGWPSHKLKWAI